MQCSHREGEWRGVSRGCWRRWRRVDGGALGDGGGREGGRDGKQQTRVMTAGWRWKRCDYRSRKCDEKSHRGGRNVLTSFILNHKRF